MKRRNFFRGLLGLIGVGSSVFLLKDEYDEAFKKIEWGDSEPPFIQMMRKSRARGAIPVKPKIEWTKKDLFPHWVEFVSQAEWDKVDAPIESAYGIRFKEKRMKRYIAHPLFEQAMKR